MPPEEQAPPAAERENKSLSALLGDSEPAEEPKKEEAAPEPEEEEKETPEVVDEPEEGEEDYESPLPEKPEAEKKPQKGERETIAQRQAKENGRKAKQLETDLATERLEKERVAAELETAKAKIADYESVRLKPQDHPEFKSLQDSILSALDNTVEDFVTDDVIPAAAGEAFKGSFPARVGECEKALSLSGEERTEAFKAIKTKIALTLFGSDYEDLLDDEKREADKTVNGLFKKIKEQIPEVKKLRELASSLEEKAKNGHLEMGVKEYTSVTSEFKPVLDSIGELPEEFVEANPYALESLVAKMAKGTPEEQKRLKNAKRDAEELLAGPAPLTQADLDRLKANGMEPKDYLKQRDKAFKAKRLKLIPLIVQALATRSTVQALLAKGGKVVEDEEQEEVETEALRTATKRPVGRPRKEEIKVPASQRKNHALLSIIGEDD